MAPGSPDAAKMGAGLVAGQAKNERNQARTSMAKDGTRMRAVVVDAFGGPERLHVASVGVPHAAADEVLLRVIAAGVGQWDGKQYRGELGPQPFPYVAGWEASGVVESVGDEVA